MKRTVNRMKEQFSFQGKILKSSQALNFTIIGNRLPAPTYHTTYQYFGVRRVASTKRRSTKAMHPNALNFPSESKCRPIQTNLYMNTPNTHYAESRFDSFSCSFVLPASLHHNSTRMKASLVNTGSIKTKNVCVCVSLNTHTVACNLMYWLHCNGPKE